MLICKRLKNMKYFAYLSIIASIVLISSCKKKELAKQEPAIASDYSNYIGNYYGVLKTDAVQFTSETESDQILASVVSSNQLTFNGTSFIIPTPQPLSFSSGNPFYNYVNLTYQSNCIRTTL